MAIHNKTGGYAVVGYLSVDQFLRRRGWEYRHTATSTRRQGKTGTANKEAADTVPERLVQMATARRRIGDNRQEITSRLEVSTNGGEGSAVKVNAHSSGPL